MTRAHGTQTNIDVRRAAEADARAIAHVHVDTWRAAYKGVIPQTVLEALDVAAREPMWRRFATTDDVAVFVAERGGRIVGFVSAGASHDEDGVGEVYAIYVHPDAWGTGAGLALMDAAVAWLRERWPEAVLWVAEANPRARRFYELYGWRPDGGRKVDTVAGGAEVAEVRYRLSGLDRR